MSGDVSVLPPYSFMHRDNVMLDYKRGSKVQFYGEFWYRGEVAGANVGRNSVYTDRDLMQMSGQYL